MKIFCLDTSALIEPWHRRYPIDVLPTFWKKIDAWAQEERIIAPEEVLVDIRKVDDDLHKWAKARESLFKPPTVEVQQAVKEILRAFPRLVDTARGRSFADPWVVAQAQTMSAVVVTEEQRATGKSPKIPNVCDSLNIECINVLGLIREMGLVL